MIHTEILPANNPTAIQRALELVRRGEVIALPTDTVYGIATDGLNAAAVEKLFIAKDRPTSKAIMLLLGDIEDLNQVAANIPPTARRLVERFWPGGLTLVVHARPELPANLRAETDTIGVRLPNSNLVREFIRSLGRPLAATSANLSGGENPRTAQDVLNSLGGRIALILDGGATPGNIPSTVVDCTKDPPRVLRAGAISIEDIARALHIRLEDLNNAGNE
ncbi:MAG TPA: L-threonylcarbamoyladenylate synthase [Anaerolineae bacterium]|nr:L-threonylcarbamoyladenylate synthase [Anaerolineae bacterium]